MNRSTILNSILHSNSKEILLELPTGFGKSKCAIEYLKHVSSKSILVVVPRNVLKVTWEEEFKKWWPECDSNITFTTYISLHKYVGSWDTIIFDECHHLSERCRELLPKFKHTHVILLSATVGREIKDSLKYIYRDLHIVKVSTRDAIDNGVLPDPKVILMPLELDDTNITESIHINKNNNSPKIVPYSFKWKALKDKKTYYIIKCTPKQYHAELCSNIDYWKNRYLRTNNIIFKNKWLKLCNDRLKWLSNLKSTTIFNLIYANRDKRTLVFCHSIEQTEIYGEYCINSANSLSDKYLRMFNAGKIDHITACNKINEGVNLVDCQVGIYANLNSSETIVNQRLGRILRHKEPIIYLPYYNNTREEELVQKMIENYNKDLIQYEYNYKG